LFGAVVTHPGASCSGSNGKLDTLVRDRTDTIIGFCENERNKGKKVDESHFYVYEENALYGFAKGKLNGFVCLFTVTIGFIKVYLL
jgi:hypothetical protein